MGFFGSIGRMLGVTGGVETDYSEALGALRDLPEYSISPRFYLDPSQYELGPSAYENIAVDPQYKDAQMAALDELIRIGEAGGLTEGDRAALEEVAEAESIRERGVREAIEQKARQRGLGGSGMELAQQLISSQGASQRAAQEGRDVARMAQNRALQALLGGGELGGKIRTQEYGEQSDLARARDLIEKFNLQNKLAMDERSADMAQRIGEMNIGGKRDVGYKKAGILSGSAQDRAAAQRLQDERAGKFAGSLFNMGGKAIGTAMGGPVGGQIGEQAASSVNPLDSYGSKYNIGYGGKYGF